MPAPGQRSRGPFPSAPPVFELNSLTVSCQIACMKLIVKICGLTTEETLDAAIAAGADMVGFVFFPPSPRYLALERATALASRARGRAEIVALTVDIPDRGLDEIVENVRPDWLQLHGNEAPERVRLIKKRCA